MPLLRRQTERREEVTLSMLFCFFAIGISAFRAAYGIATWLVLRIEFGSQRVAHDHIRIIDEKGKNMVFSNGTPVPVSLGVAHRFIMLGGWLVLAFLFWAIVFQLFPKQRHPLLNLVGLGPNINAVIVRLGVAVIVLTIVGEFFLLMMSPPLVCAMTATGVVLASLGASWLVWALARGR